MASAVTDCSPTLRRMSEHDNETAGQKWIWDGSLYGNEGLLASLTSQVTDCKITLGRRLRLAEQDAQSRPDRAAYERAFADGIRWALQRLNSDVPKEQLEHAADEAYRAGERSGTVTRRAVPDRP